MYDPDKKGLDQIILLFAMSVIISLSTFIAVMYFLFRGLEWWISCYWQLI